MRKLFFLLLLFAVSADAYEGRVSPLNRSTKEAHEAMINLAGITPVDVVYDLGSGTGELVAAIARTGAAAIGIEIVPIIAQTSQKYLFKSGLNAEIRNEDFFKSKINDATVVMLYLGDKPNLMVRSKLQKELRPGTRVISLEHDMGEWKPDKTAELRDGTKVFLWHVK